MKMIKKLSAITVQLKLCKVLTSIKENLLKLWSEIITKRAFTYHTFIYYYQSGSVSII